MDAKVFDPRNPIHDVLRVTLKSGEVFVLDVTGANMAGVIS